MRASPLCIVGVALVIFGCGTSSGGGDQGDGAGSSGTGGTLGTSGTSSSGAGGGASGTSGTTGSGGASGGVGPSGGGGGVGAAGGSVGTGGAGMAGSGTGGAGAGAGNAGTAGSGGSVIVGGISDLRVEANPRNVCSAYVRWTTPEASSSVVQFGEGGALSFEISGEAGVTEHEVLVIGMHAQTEYQIRALSTSAAGTLEGMTTFTTGALPAQIPAVTISVHDQAKTAPGWTLMNVQKGDGTNRAYSGAPPAAVIFDEAGKPVWYFIHGTRNERGGAISVDMTDSGVLIGPSLTTGSGSPAVPPIEVDWAGNTLWTCSDPLCGVPDQLSHHASKLSNGNYIVMRDMTSGGRTSQVFIEFSPQGQQVRTIGVEDAMTPPQGATGDWAHGNFIKVDLERDVAYMSFRWLGLVKMTYSTKMWQWHLPASYGQSSLGNFGDMTFDPPASQFTDIHAPDINTDGTILFFDNGGFSGVVEDGNPGNRHTRAVEYRIDETAKRATLTWEWPGSFQTDAWYKQQLYVPFWGDADRLSNGNVLIAAGRRGTSASTPESRVIEVTRDTGQVVWELRFPKDYGVYRAERLDPLPLVRRIAQ